MNYSEFTISASHPCLVGHFPGNPIVPAVVVLERVIEAVAAEHVGTVAGIRRCKFISPLRAEQLCTVEWALQDQGVKFECSSATGIVVRGVLQVDHG